MDVAENHRAKKKFESEYRAARGRRQRLIDNAADAAVRFARENEPLLREEGATTEEVTEAFRGAITILVNGG